MTFTKIDKRKARNEFNVGKTIGLTPCKCRPTISNMFLVDIDLDGGLDFDLIVSEFIYYNCDYERGYYPSFYLVDTE